MLLEKVYRFQKAVGPFPLVLLEENLSYNRLFIILNLFLSLYDRHIIVYINDRIYHLTRSHKPTIVLDRSFDKGKHIYYCAIFGFHSSRDVYESIKSLMKTKFSRLTVLVKIPSCYWQILRET